jgi:transcription antitermination factor NusG
MHPSDRSTPPSSCGMPSGWYAVYTRHQHEKSAAQLLTRKGFEVLLPLYCSRSRWSDRIQTVLLPLFPNYLFVQCGLDSRVQVLQTAGVCWFVSNAGAPTAVPEAEIEMVRRVVEAPVNVQPHSFLDRGERVRVLRGPLAGLTGILMRVKNQCRVIISLELVRKSAAIEIDLSDLGRTSAPSPAKVSQRLPMNSWQSARPGKSARAFVRDAQTSEFSYGK